MIPPEANREIHVQVSSKTWIWLRFLVAILALMRFDARASDPLPSQYQLKAAFLYNFAKFVDWPPSAYSSATAPFVIGLIGQNPFGNELERTVTNKMIAGHAFVVKQLKSLSEAARCQILFISTSERKRLPDILKAVRGQSVLTVSELDRFLQAGGMIQFIMEGNRVRFEINDAAARQAGLRISSKLLGVARRPEGESKP